MFMYVNIKDMNLLRFKGCDNCTTNCCDGSRISLSPLILDDFYEVYENFAIGFAKIETDIKPVVILNDGKSSCKYNINNKCTIYDIRPPACKMYPISPYIDGNIYVDVSCEAVGMSGEFLCDSNGFSDAFYHKRVQNITHKLRLTFEWTQKISDNLVPLVKIKDIMIFKYNGDINDQYIQMHQKSLVHVK